MPINLNHLKAYIKDRHISQASIAGLLGMKCSTLNMILSGNRGMFGMIKYIERAAARAGTSDSGTCEKLNTP